MLLVSLQVFKPKLKSKSQDIKKSFKFNSKTLSHCLAKYKIKEIRTCRHNEKIHKSTKKNDLVYAERINLTKLRVSNTRKTNKKKLGLLKKEKLI